METLALLDEFIDRLEQDYKDTDDADAKVLEEWLQPDGWDELHTSVDTFLNEVIEGKESNYDLKVRRFDEAHYTTVSVPKRLFMGELEDVLGKEFKLPLGSFGFNLEGMQAPSMYDIPKDYTLGDLIVNGLSGVRLYPIGIATWYLKANGQFNVPVQLRGPLGEGSRIVTVSADSKMDVHQVWLAVSQLMKLQYDWNNDMGAKPKLSFGQIGNRIGPDIYRTNFWTLWSDQLFTMPEMTYKDELPSEGVASL